MVGVVGVVVIVVMVVHHRLMTYRQCKSIEHLKCGGISHGEHSGNVLGTWLVVWSYEVGVKYRVEELGGNVKAYLYCSGSRSGFRWVQRIGGVRVSTLRGRSLRRCSGVERG